MAFTGALTRAEIEQAYAQRHDCAYIIQDTVKTVDGEFIPCIAIEGVPGYHKTDWHWGTDRGIAQECANDKNQQLGLSADRVIEITLSSLGVIGVKTATG
jgi:hypothetical protein